MKEKELKIKIKDSYLNTYKTGKGKETLIFLPGFSTTSPILDFRSLYSILKYKYKIVVIERFGYGESSINSNSRDIDTVLNETREAIKKLKIKTPYIIVPFSMAGIEAIYWSIKYPKELKAIVAIDPAVEPFYKDIRYKTSTLKIASILKNNKTLNQLLLEFIPSNKYGTLTETEKNKNIELFNKKFLNENVINESRYIKTNLKKIIKSQNKIKIPIHFFISNGKNTITSRKKWIRKSKKYIKKIKYGTYELVNASHSLHNVKTNHIAKKIEEYINRL